VWFLIFKKPPPVELNARFETPLFRLELPRFRLELPPFWKE